MALPNWQYLRYRQHSLAEQHIFLHGHATINGTVLPAVTVPLLRSGGHGKNRTREIAALAHPAAAMMPPIRPVEDRGPLEVPAPGRGRPRAGGIEAR